MDLQDVIKNMEAGSEGQVKSAQAQVAPATQQQNLDAALEKAAGNTAPVAQPVDAVESLMKTANELAGAEKEAELAHAALCGQAFADGAISKFAQYDAQAQQAGVVKQAAQAEFALVAAQSEDALIKAAAEQGYADAQEKIATEYKAGHDAVMQQVHDSAASEFLKGAAEVEVMVAIAQQQVQQ